jgi:hypothetical protein
LDDDVIAGPTLLPLAQIECRGFDYRDPELGMA